MHSTTSLASLLKSEFPSISFVPGNIFAWSHIRKQVEYIADSSDTASLLHELSHALLGHKTYRRDIELLGYERDAWAHAIALGPKYKIKIEEETIQNALDTYRDWLHARSKCPICSASGMQTAPSTYTCPACNAAWKVNSATTCALKRYTIKKRTI